MPRSSILAPLLLALWAGACGGDAEPAPGAASAENALEPAAAAPPSGEAGPAKTGPGGPAEGLAADVTVDVPPLDVPVEWIETVAEDGVTTRRQVRRDGQGFVNHGAFTRVWPNGEVQEQGEYRDGLPVGLHVVNFESGMRKSESTYREGLAVGLRKTFFPLGGLKKLESFAAGKKHGRSVEFYSGGEQKKLEDSWVEGQRTGPYFAWHEDGSPAEEGAFERGKASGYWRTYFAPDPEAGLPHRTASQGNYVRGRPDGFWERWHPNGKLAEQRNFKLGEQDGDQTHFDEAGQRTVFERWREGAAEGPRREWYPDGTPKSERTFVAGAMTGPAVDWFENGAKWSEGELVDGRREGAWRFWNADGSENAEWSGSYVQGERTGP